MSLSHRKFREVYLFFSIATLFTIFLLLSRDLGEGYFDEVYYLRAGVDYVRGVCPAHSNPEHPPLAKYLIGISALVNPAVVPALFGFLSAISLALWMWKTWGSYLYSILTSVVLLSEVAYTKTFNYTLLDSVAVGFASTAIYMSILTSRPLVSGLLWGAALSSKLSTAYSFIGVLVFRVLERRFRDLLTEFAVASSIYLATFIGDLICSSGGFELLVSHLVFIPVYMLRVHGLSFYKAIQGLSVALLKIEFWSARQPLTVTINPDTLSNVTLGLGVIEGLEVRFYPWLSGFLLPSSISLLLYALLKYRKLVREVRGVVLVTLFTYVNVLHGAIFWYFTLPTYCVALLAGSILSRKTLTVFAIANTLSIVVIYLLSLNYTVFFILPK